MGRFQREFDSRQYMLTDDFELFHYRSSKLLNIEYHNHDFYELYFLVSGKVTYYVEGRSYALAPGDILILSDQEMHRPSQANEDPYERIVVWIRPAYLRALGAPDFPLAACFEALPHGGGNQLRMDPAALQEFRETLDDLEEAYASEEPGAGLLRTAYFVEGMVRLNRAFRAAREGRSALDGEVSAAPSTRTARLIRFVNDHIAEDLGLDRLAAEFYVSKYHMLREFRRHTGVTIHQYVLTKRLILARHHLRRGTPVAEVCRLCGFRDPSNFARLYPREYGLSPKEEALSL
jgi:AraC-like DNA-binding protein/mannose-6-phosphate isomerase-like protein (cupin superfamily)